MTFREDGNQSLNRLAAQNLSIIRKWRLSILKLLELVCPNLSMKKKCFIISMSPPEFLEQVLAFLGRECFRAFVVVPPVNVKKNLDKEGNISHWKMAQKCRIGGMGQCGRKAVSRHCRDVARQQTSVKGHKNFSGCMPGKFFVFAALTLDPG